MLQRIINIKSALDELQASGEPATGALMIPSLAKQLRDEIKSDASEFTWLGAIKILTSPYCPPDTIYFGNAEELQDMAERTAEKYRVQGLPLHA